MSYQITSIERTTFLNERANPVDGYRVTFVLASGIVDYVDVPKSRYSDETVKAMIEESMKRHQAVLGKPTK